MKVLHVRPFRFPKRLAVAALALIVIAVSLPLVITQYGRVSARSDLTVRVTNRSAFAVSDVVVKTQSGMRSIDQLAPGDSRTLTFPTVRGESGFHVSMTVRDTRRSEDVGYIDHSSIECEIDVVDGSENNHRLEFRNVK